MTAPIGDVHARARAAARALLANSGGELSESAREVIGYYQSCLRGADRAAADVLRFATTLGVRVDDAHS